MMGKVGIITIIDNNNYGNRLQNYAVQEILKKLDCKVETIINWPNTNHANSRIGEIKKEIRRELGKIKRKIKYMKHKQMRQRYRCFKKFNVDNMKFSNKTLTYYKAKKIEREYDFFVVGSDQVWNPNFDRLSEIDLLTFSNQQKNIAYSASFGVSYIPGHCKEKCKKAFSNFKSISVREEAGKNIIHQLDSKKEVEVLIDPTMMLDEKEWSKVARKPKQLKSDKYILNYFLGKLSKEREKEIERIAEKNNCEVINILDENGEFYGTGPSEFLYLVKNSFLICTDSFHSCVFSILFNRPFVIFDREENIVSMNSRIETLLEKFKLEDKKYNELNGIKDEQLKIDYTQSYKILEQERKKTIAFLKQAIN